MRVTITNPTGSKKIDAKINSAGLVKWKDESKQTFVDHVISFKHQGWVIVIRPFKWREFFSFYKKRIV